jgi:acetoin utilization protein AcuB
MFVRDYMTRNPITVTPETTFPQAIKAIRNYKIRHLPVVDSNKLVGLIVENDLLSNQPSKATTLSVFEIYSLLDSLQVNQMMSKPVITVEGDCPIEEAARIMVDNKISCLPVMAGSDLVGIITETDIFKALVMVLGGKERGLRLHLRLPDKVGELAAVAAKIAETGGNIVAVTSSSHSPEGGLRDVTIKEAGADQEVLVPWLHSSGIEIIDICQCEKYQPKLFE